MEDPLKALIRKTHKQSSPLSSAEQAVYDWFINKKENIKSRERAYAMQNMGEYMRSFGGPFLDDEVERDMQFNKEQRDKEGGLYKTERADIFEAVFYKWAQEAKWFGNNCEIIPTLEYDDRRNHADFVIIFKKPDGKSVKLAIDCTVTEDENVLRSKAFYTARGIETNNLTTIKYFSDPATRKKSKIGVVPRVIAATENNRITELCESVLLAIKGNQRELSGNYFQYYLLKEFELQLEAQLYLINNSININKTSRFAEMKANIQEAKSIISELIREKESSLDPKVFQRAKREIAHSRVFMALPPLHRKLSHELRR